VTAARTRLDAGEFMLGNRRYCYPLTITDFASRFLLACEALSTTQEKFAFTVFERTFKEFGLPHVIRTDNGVPFASAHAIDGLSKLEFSKRSSKLGIVPPTHPGVFLNSPKPKTTSSICSITLS
jgi:transposase InsO family protein